MKNSGAEKHWLALYKKAVLEADPSKLDSRISQAQHAIRLSASLTRPTLCCCASGIAMKFTLFAGSHLRAPNFLDHNCQRTEVIARLKNSVNEVVRPRATRCAGGHGTFRSGLRNDHLYWPLR
jgi:hypothetical protein